MQYHFLIPFVTFRHRTHTRPGGSPAPGVGSWHHIGPPFHEAHTIPRGKGQDERPPPSLLCRAFAGRRRCPGKRATWVGIDRWAWPLRNGQAAAGWVGAGLGRWARPLRNGLAGAGWVGPPSMPGWGLASAPVCPGPVPSLQGLRPQAAGALAFPWCGGTIS